MKTFFVMFMGGRRDPSERYRCWAGRHPSWAGKFMVRASRRCCERM